jgi:hypothetical protein
MGLASRRAQYIIGAMTTRILSSRALRLVLALVIVALLLASRAPIFVPSIALVGVALAWLLVPGDRRWFVPASLVVVAAGFVWPFFAGVRYQLGDGSQLMVQRLTGAVQVLPPNRERTSTDWYRFHPNGWVALTPILRPSLLGYLGLSRPKRTRTVAADTFAVVVPPVPDSLAVSGGCLQMSGGTWVRCPDIEYLPPIWPGQRVVTKDTIAADRLRDGRCDWGRSMLKLPPTNLASTIGERHPKTCRAVVYNITMGWIPPREAHQ